MSKRKAERQLTDRDDLEAADEEQEDGTWKEASSDVLARRRIVRAPRRGGSTTALAPEPPANNAPKEEKQNEEKQEKAVQEQKEKAETDSKETKQEAEQSDAKWPKYNIADSATGASTIGSNTAWPTFSFSTAAKTEEETSKSVEWPTFTSPATTDTSSTTPNFGFPSLSGLGSTSWPTFSFSTEKKDDANQSAASSATTWPTFNFSATPTKAADDDKTEKKDNVWPSFESPLSNASSAGTEAGFKLIPSLGTLTGVGGDAKKTVELTTGGSGRWEVGSAPLGSEFGTSSPSEVGTLASPKLAKVEKHTTGEEDENQELEIRAKLFEFTKDDASEAGGFKWTERGVGQLKLKSAQGRARIVMRTENALRVILNAAIFPQMKVDKVNDKQIKFTCVNSIDGSTQKVGSFLAKVASAADGSTLYDTLAKLKTASANAPKEQEQQEQKEQTEKDGQTKTPERAEPEKNAD